MEQIKNKIINKKFILKAILYIAFLWWGYYVLLGLVPIPAAALIYSICLNDRIHEIINNNFDIFLLVPIFSPFASYILAKIFGIFKFIDNLKTNMFKKIVLLTLISIFSFLILIIRFKFIEDQENFAYYISSCIFTLIPAFFLYKYFQYLTKKYPKPFEKIGYYTSIEFFKDILNKFKN